jgi:sodium/hydrogen exchanger-like protein 3
VSFLVVAGGGTVIGILMGYACAFVTRFMEQAQLLEPLVVLSFAYLSYLTAEIFHMSGILAITFCGITMKNYVEQNISESSSNTIKSAAHMIANCAEMMIFLFLGVFTVNNIHEWNWWFVICTIGCCLVFRVIGVLLLVAIANRFRIKKLDWLEQFIMMYGGLRGGVAFALVLTITPEVAPHAKMFVTTTLAMVYFTVFVQGITIGPLVKLLKVRQRSSAAPSMAVRVSERLMDQAKTGMEDILGDNSEVPLRVRNWYKKVADSVLKPLLLRSEVRNNAESGKMLDTFQQLCTHEAMELVRNRVHPVPRIVVGEEGHHNKAFAMVSV